MNLITADSAAKLYEDTLWLMHVGEVSDYDTRNGRARVLDLPLTLRLIDPRQRVIWEPNRNPNPFFHYMEAFWMLAGRMDSEWIVQFNRNMKTYAEDDGNFHGAYGWRWRRHFSLDQLQHCVAMLSRGDDRRCVLGMWSPNRDLNSQKKDLPCNVLCTFRIREGRLTMHVFNRSNDVIWGMLGSNVVHFSILLEYLAACSDLEVGEMYQISTNAHIYERHWSLLDPPASPITLPPCAFMFDRGDQAGIDRDLETFLRGDANFRHPGFKDAFYMKKAYLDRNPDELENIGCEAWRIACKEWWKLNRSDA